VLPVYSSASLYPLLPSASFHLDPDCMKKSKSTLQSTFQASVHEKSRKLKLVELGSRKSMFNFFIEKKCNAYATI
jgi:hypothetical protein